jgi:hypothetical protein
MNNIKYWGEKGFIKVADLFVSDRLKQGVDVSFNLDKDDYKKQPGVYLVVSEEGEILKIGQSANVFHRINTQYKCISNSGNDRIRDEIKRKYKKVSFYVLKTPKQQYTLLNYSFYINYQKGLEEAMLQDYYKQIGDTPVLNLQRN